MKKYMKMCPVNIVLVLSLCTTFAVYAQDKSDDALLATDPLLSSNWDPVSEADAVLKRLVKITATQVKGAHDAEMVLVGNHAYIVAEVNDEKPGEAASWDFIYSAMSIVNLQTLKVEKIIPFARSEQRFENTKLPKGICWIPRIIQKDESTLRCYFVSECPGKSQGQVWYIDYDLASRLFAKTIHKVKIKIAAGTFDMQPRYFHDDAKSQGFKKKPKDYGCYIFDSFKEFDGKIYVALNNYPGMQNALARVNDKLDTFEVIGHYNEPQSARLCESAVNRLLDGTWMAICRNDGGDQNYLITTSQDGRTWTTGKPLASISNGGNSKPTFDYFDSVYYLGWQEKTTVKGVTRSIFNVDISSDGKKWQRKYSFKTTNSFQYPSFFEHNNAIWLCVTQGDSSPSRKERIMFGRLENLNVQE